MNNSKFWNSGGSQNVRNPIKFNFNFKSAGFLVLIAVVAVIALLFAVFVGPVKTMISDVKVTKSDGNAILAAMSNRDLVALDSALNKFEKDLQTDRTDRDKKFGWAKNIGLFKLSEFYSDTDHFINAGNDMVDALRQVEVAVKPFADAAGLKVSANEQVPSDGGLMKAFQSWVSIMPQVANQMDGVIDKLSQVGKEFAGINTAKYPTNLFGIPVRQSLAFAKTSLSNISGYAPDIKQALTIFPRLLAVGTPEKRYMIIMQNDKEIRATGGFMTNYATFKVLNGLLGSDFTSKDMYSIDLILQNYEAYTNYQFPAAPPAYTKYLKVEHWYARDMNYSPDFVTSMDTFMKTYNFAGRINPVEIKPVDGIIAIDTDVISDLLGVTGPVTVSGVTYTKDNVVLELEKIASLELSEQANRKRVLGDLMQQMLINVFQSDKNLWSKLIDEGINLAIQKHIQVYMFDADAEALIEKYNIGGRIILDTPGDYSAVISTNLGGDKTNWFTTKKIGHTLTKEGDKWVDTVTITYTYTQPSVEYAAFVKRFKDWVRVYAPLGSQIISVDGTEDGTSTDQELNKTYFTGYIELGPGETKTMTFKYYLPSDRVGPDNYTLTIQKQAGIDTEIHTVTVNGKTQQVNLDRDTKVVVPLK